MATQAAGTGRRDPAKKKKKLPGTFGASVPIALIGVVATVIGFMPTFFLRQSQVDVAHLLHGWIMTGWIVLALTQALLARSRQYKVHRVLGWSSMALFVAMVITSCHMLALMLSGKTRLPFELAKFFGYSDIVNMPLLIFFYCGAIYWRKDRHLHSRLVMITVLTSIVPALARMFNILIWRSLPGLSLAMHPTYILILAALGISAYRDLKNGKLRWPLPLALGWFAVEYATQWPMMNVQWYDALAKAIGALA